MTITSVCVRACVCVCVCARACALYEIFTSIFLNLLCNFTVNNCIILFQVSKKPVMTRTRISLYSQIYLSCSHLRQAHNHSYALSERGKTLDALNAVK